MNLSSSTTLKNIEIVGVHKHIGSQLMTVSPYVEALRKILGLVEQLKGIGVEIRYLNVGGELGITYQDEVPPLSPRISRVRSHRSSRILNVS